MDAVGEWATTSIAHGTGNQLALMKEIKFPHSLGLLYSAFTYFAGFKVNSGEYKLMGLAPYGEPKYVDLLKSNVIEIKSDGSFLLNLDYFDYCTGKQMTSSRFEELFKRKARAPESDIEQFHLDLAASIQDLTEDIVIGLATHAKKVTGEDNLCLAGGVALNCVANGKLRNLGLFEKIWVQPAAGDAGGAVGAALAVHYMALGGERNSSKEFDDMSGALLGPSFSEFEVVSELEKLGAVFKVCSFNDMVDQVVEAIANGKAVGWMQGRMEFGPRALGARSILADARSPQTQRDLNLKTKFRESFRPFAPSVLLEDVAEWFDFEGPSPYMLMVSKVAQNKWLRNETEKNGSTQKSLDQVRTLIPAVTHVDYSARIQTVDKRESPLFHALLSRFKQVTGCPVVVNTSFNIRGEPIVCSPTDAFRCFMGTNIDLLVIGNVVLKKSEQVTSSSDYKNNYELD
jgi:carbamoyltransferase